MDELAGIEAKIAEVKAQRKAAMSNVELDKVAELDEQLDALKDQRTEAKTAPKPADTQGKPANLADYNAAFDASLAKAANLYPFIQEAESAAAMRMVEIDNALAANKDPLFSAPDKPLRIAQMVAAEMAIAPRTASAVKTPTAAKSQQVTPRSVSPIASGASRTTTTRTQDASSAAEILSIKTSEDLERYLAGRIGRFILNALLASGGYPWAIVRVEHRQAYISALENASVRHDIRDFTRFIAAEMAASEDLKGATTT